MIGRIIEVSGDVEIIFFVYYYEDHVQLGNYGTYGAGALEGNADGVTDGLFVGELDGKDDGTLEGQNEGIIDG